jgi:hypothetical protein
MTPIKVCVKCGAANAMRQALSDFEWIERMVPGSNLQASILLLRHALAWEEKP